MSLQRITPSQIPMSLLLEADPCEESVNSYLWAQNGYCFAAMHDKSIVGVCIANPIKGEDVVEIFNVSVTPSLQAQGIGTKLLSYSLEQLASNGVTRVELGTGSFGYQLTYYQRLGFRVDAIIKDHFLDNYSEPIFEYGVQHKDMLRLAIEL
ncbi:GNAT family N-acetyltransferase [Photobacterium jeanii]